MQALSNNPFSYSGLMNDRIRVEKRFFGFAEMVFRVAKLRSCAAEMVLATVEMVS